MSHNLYVWFIFHTQTNIIRKKRLIVVTPVFSQLTLHVSKSYRKRTCPGFDPVTPLLKLNNSWQYLSSCYSFVFSCLYNDSYTHTS